MFNPRTGKMLVTCGSHVDIGLEPDPRRAAILEFNPDGSPRKSTDDAEPPAKPN